MKLTRSQLRRLIEGSIRKRGDYVIPVEDPIEDPIEDLDYSDKQKPKIKTLAMSDDEENQEYANYIADLGGHEDTDRFGADTFSKKVQATELGTDVLNDLDIDSAITKACDYWIYENKDYLSYFDNIDQDSFAKYADYMIEEYDGDQAIVNAIKVHTTAVLDKRIKSLIDISNSAASVPSVDKKVGYYENAKKLFSTAHNNLIVEDHILFKFRSVLYKFYLDWKDYYEAEQGYDLSNPEHIERYKKNISMFKEGKVKIKRSQLRRLISEVTAFGCNKHSLGYVDEHGNFLDISAEDYTSHEEWLISKGLNDLYPAQNYWIKLSNANELTVPDIHEISQSQLHGLIDMWIACKDYARWIMNPESSYLNIYNFDFSEYEELTIPEFIEKHDRGGSGMEKFFGSLL